MSRYDVDREVMLYVRVFTFTSMEITNLRANMLSRRCHQFIVLISSKDGNQVNEETNPIR